MNTYRTVPIIETIDTDVALKLIKVLLEIIG